MASIVKRRRARTTNSTKMSGYNAGTMHSSSGSSQRSMNENVTNFQNAMRLLLHEAERDQMTDILAYYHRSRNVYHLVTSLENVLDTSTKRKLVPLLRKVLPKGDRPQFDQHMSQGVYVNKQTGNGGHSISQVPTDDSGIGSNTATTQSSRVDNSRKMMKKPQAQYLSHDSHKREGSQSSSNRSSTFGSAVRRKVKAAMQQRSLSAKKFVEPSPRRRHSFAGTLDVPESRIGVKDINPGKSTNTTTRKREKISPYWPRDVYDDVKVVFMNRSHKNEPMGFSIRGGAEHNLGIYISHVELGSAADECGLLLGDQILRVNNTPFLNDATHNMAAETLSATSGKLVLYVRSVGQVPDSIVTSHNFVWTDTYGRPTSPPPDAAIPPGSFARRDRSDLRLLLTDERRVNLTVAEGQRLGLMVRGGTEYGLGIYITGVDPNSASEQAGLKAGDQILEVNNINFKSISHADAVNVIRSNRMLMMMIKHVGRIPQCHVSQEETRWMSDDKISYHSMRISRNGSLPRRPGSSLGMFQRGLAGSDQVTLRHAQSTTSLTLSPLERALAHVIDEVEEPGLLTDEELKTLRYYANEYILGHVTVDALVLSLSQLLDTHTKFSLMSAVRRCIVSRDLDRFDVLVLRREVETLKRQHDAEKNHPNGNEEHHTTHYIQKKDRETRRHSSRRARTTPRSHSAPPDRGSMAEGDHQPNNFESNNSNESSQTYLPPPNASSTPNDSQNQENEYDVHSPHPPPVIMSSSSQPIYARVKKTVSPIFKNNTPMLPSPMKLIPPAKPKRTTLGTSTNDESGARESHSWSENHANSNDLSHNSLEQTSFNSSNQNKFNNTGSVGRLYPRKHEVNRVNFGAPDDDRSVRRTPSPFTQAIEKHATASRISKASTAPAHTAIPGPEFFEPPQELSPPRQQIPRTDPQQHKILNRAGIPGNRNYNHVTECVDSGSDFPDDNPLPPPPMSFLQNQDSNSSYRYPVTVDVHRAPLSYASAKNAFEKPGYMDLPSESVNIKKSVSISPHTTAVSNTTYRNVQNKNNSNCSAEQNSNSLDSDEYNGIEYEDVIDPREYLKGVEKQKIIVFKVALTLGLSVEGGANTRQPLPRIASILPGGCAHMCGRLVPGHVIHRVNSVDMAGMEHSEIAKTIASAFQSKARDSLELLVSGPHSG